MTNDERFMARCIQLARNGLAGAAPNPMVGAVIVSDRSHGMRRASRNFRIFGLLG